MPNTQASQTKPDNEILAYRIVDQWFNNYSRDHRHQTNILIHWICVPAILWTVIAMLWTIPVPALIGRPGLWAAAAMFATFAFYLRLARVLAFGMLVVFIAFGAISEAIYRILGPTLLWQFALGMFVIAWVAQFVGHQIEGKRPSFLTDLAYLLIGPLWLTAKVMQRFGVTY